MKTSQQVTVVGGIPRPIGGVTNFVYRLICHQPTRFSRLLDMYPGPDKEKIPVEHIQLTSGFLGLLRICTFSSHKNFLFNFSRAHSLLFLALLPKGENRWGIILHNGSLHVGKHVKYLAPLMRRALKKMDAIAALSPAQLTFYESLGVTSPHLQLIQAYVPCTRPTADEIARLVPKEISNWITNGKRVFIMSGYPTKIYQHLEIISVFEKIWKEDGADIRLAAFLYGKDSDNILKEIQLKLGNSKNSRLYWDTDERCFSASLSIATGYIRMNTVDSFGIAVADAVSLSVPAIATNVCERYAGAVIVDPFDFQKLSDFITQGYKNNPFQSYASPNSHIDGFLDKLVCNR